MKTEKYKKELEIFKYLDDECNENSTPIPDKMFDLPLKFEIFGIMSKLICDSFRNMREADGKTNWECNAKLLIGTKLSQKRLVTLNSLRKLLLVCQGAELIEYVKESDDEITVKLNVTFLFDKENVKG